MHNEDNCSFEVNKMTVQTDQLLCIKKATNVKNIYPEEHEVKGRKKALVQSLKQFHTHFYWLYEKGMTGAMVGLQGLHLGNVIRCPNISAGVELKSFWPWCFKLGRNTETIVYLWEVHYRMAIMCDICLAFAGMTTQSVLDHCSGCKMKDMECEGHEKAQKFHKKKEVQVTRTKGCV